MKTIFSKYFFIALSLIFIYFSYLSTMLPSQDFHDVGEFQTIVPTLNAAHPTGYPTYVILGKILVSFIPYNEPAWRVNFLSVLYSLATLLFLWLIVLKITKSYNWSVFGILILGFAKPFWDYAGLADAQTLNRLFIFGLFYLFLLIYEKYQRKFFLLFFFLFALGLGNHLLLLYTSPVFLTWYLLAVFKKKIPFKVSDLFLGFLVFLLGLSTYLLLPLKEYFPPTLVNDKLNNFNNFYRHITGADSQGLMFQGGLSEVIKKMTKGLLILKDLYGISLILGLFGLLYEFFKYRLITVLILILFFSLLSFSTNYPVADQNRYHLSFISVYVLLIGFGIVSIANLFNSVVRRLPLGFLLKKIILVFLFLIFFTLPFILFKNNYPLVDKSNNFQAALYSKEVFESLPNNSVIISWWNYTTPLWYRKFVLSEREDVLIENRGQGEWEFYIDKYVGQRPVFISDFFKPLVEKYLVTRYGNVYQVLPKN